MSIQYLKFTVLVADLIKPEALISTRTLGSLDPIIFFRYFGSKPLVDPTKFCQGEKLVLNENHHQPGFPSLKYVKCVGG